MLKNSSFLSVDFSELFSRSCAVTACLGAILSVSAPLQAHAAIRSEVVKYSDGDTQMEGLIVYDSAKKGKLPGVVVVHDWMGRSDFSDGKAQELAKLGYIAISADIYGVGVRPKDATEAGKLAGKYKSDRTLLRSRAVAALTALKNHKQTDPNRLGAIGFCFGGTTILEMARAGLPLKGVVSFHGGLETPMPAKKDAVQAQVLVLHGADDPYVPGKEVAGFVDEMKAAGVHWSMTQYSGAVHSFTNPAAGTDPSKGAAYQEVAARRSWLAMKEFFAEVFAN